MPQKLTQKGFTLIEGLLIIIALALVVFVGYYVYHAQRETSKTYSAASKDAQSTPAKSSPKKATTATDTKAELEAYLIETCSTGDSAAIKALFSGQTQQTAESDNYKLEGNYAIVNVTCNLKDGNQLTTEVLKRSTAKWNLLIDKPTSVSCTYLTDQGFPDSVKAAYCANGVGGEGNF